MLKGKLLHPQILEALAASGHGSMILISDGNYPHITGSPQTAKKVFLNLSPGTVKVTEVLQALVSAIPIESVAVMNPPSDKPLPEIYSEFKKILPEDVEWKNLQRFDFYDFARNPNTSLVIATGDQRLYANIILTIGVVPP
jgi:L-fucose mutarotase